MSRKPGPYERPGASDVVKAVKGIELPANRDELLEIAKENGAEDRILDVIKRMPNREYKDARDIGVGLGEASRGEAA